MLLLDSEPSVSAWLRAECGFVATHEKCSDGRALRPMRFEKRALGVSLKHREEVGLGFTQHRTEVSEQLRQRLPRRAQRRRRLTAQAAS